MTQKVGGGKDLKSCSFTIMTVDAGLSWGPHCLSTPASLYGLTLWTSLDSRTAWWLACSRASIPKGREPDGNCVAFCASLGSHQTSRPIVLYLRGQSQAPTNFKQKEYRPHISWKESKSHTVRQACGMKDLCCGHLEKYNLPHLSSRLQYSH